MQWLAEVCVRRPVFASVLILVLVVVGIVGYFKLGVDRFPKVDLPVITVTTRLPGAAPEEVETELTDKIEEAVNTISGIDELRSISSEGVSQVFITFLLDKDVDVAAQEVRDHVNSVLPDLPEDIEPPTVTKLDPDASPILFLASHRRSPGAGHHRVRRQDRAAPLENVSGVGQVTIVGGRKRQINMLLDPRALARVSASPRSTSQRAMRQQNAQTPGGSVDTGPHGAHAPDRAAASAACSELDEIVVRNATAAPSRSATSGASTTASEEPRPPRAATARRRSCSPSASSRARTACRSPTPCASA